LKDFLSRDFPRLSDEDTTLHGDGRAAASAEASPTRLHRELRFSSPSFAGAIPMAKKKRATKKAGKKKAAKKKGRRKARKM
jgi:hypothetical protein